MAEVRNSMDAVSHGRGGAGNIGADDTPYVDGEIVREGTIGDHGDGPFSTGRGGAANVGSSGINHTERHDKEIIPEVAMRPSQDETHVGRGGAGNVQHAEEDIGPSHPVGLADKLKNKLFKSKGKQESTTE